MSDVITNSEAGIKRMFTFLDALTEGTRYYVGITNNHEERMKTHHNNYKVVGKWYYHMTCQNSTIAAKVEKHFVSKKYNNRPIDGGPGGGTGTSVYVYAFSHNGKR